jgi:hypothetical protein
VRRSQKSIALLAATFLVALLVVSCGGDSDESERAVPQTTTAAQKGTEEDRNGNGGDPTESNGDSSPENPCEETVCHLLKKEEGGGTFLCTGLEVVRVPAEAEEATEPGEPGETSEAEASETPTETVLRPRCPEGAKEIPVEGIDLEERPDVSISEDGQAAWTTQPVRIEGRIREGKFVPDE